MSFLGVRLDGGGCCNVLAKNGNVIVGGSDTQGYYITTDKATTWKIQNTGIGKSNFYRQCAALIWSTTETNTLYSLTGEQGAGGGLLAGAYNPTTGVINWSLRSGVPQGSGNHCAAPLPTDGWKRSTGRLLYQDSLYLFAGTYNQGVMRSSNTGGGGGGGTAGLFGNTSTVNLYANTSTHALAATAADNATSRTMAYSVQKIFFGSNAFPPNAIQDGNGTLVPLANVGCRFYLCVLPPHPGTPADATSLQNALQSWINAWPVSGGDPLTHIKVVLFQEVQDKLTAAEYLAVCNNYVPAIHALGLKVAFVNAGHARGTNGTGWTSYYPINPGVTPGSAQDNLCDEVCVDEYGATWIQQGGSATFDPLQPAWQMADLHGKAFGITEMGSGVAVSPVSITEPNFITYIQQIQQLMVNRLNAGKASADCMWYNGDNNAAVINTLSGPHTTVAAGSNGGIISQIASWNNPSPGVLKVASTAGFGTSSRAGPMWIQCDDGSVARINYNQIVADSTTFGANVAGQKCTFISGNPNATVSTGNFMAVWEFQNGVTSDFRIPYVQTFADTITVSPGVGSPGKDNFPVTFNMNGASGNGWFVRAISPDPNTSTTLYAAVYDTTGAPAGVYKSTNAHATQPNMTQIAGTPTTAEDLFVIGDYLYVAAGNFGLKRYGPLSGTPAWQDLNGSGSIPNSSATNVDWWSNVAGYVDGSSNHIVYIGNSNNQNVAQCLMKLIIPSNYPTGSITYSNETGTVTTATEPPGYTWWEAGGSFHPWLGGGGFFCPFTLIDSSNLAAIDLWTSGSSGMYRRLHTDANWRIAQSGCPMFLGHPVAANPVHAGHLVFGSSDWCFHDDSRAGTEDASTLINDPPVSGTQGFSAAISADGGTVYGSQGQKYTNATGEVWSRPWNSPNSWTKMNLGVPVASGGTGGKVAIGLAAFNDNSVPPKQIVMAGVRASGMWRWNGTAWSNRNATFLSTDASGLLMQISYALNGIVFAYDRGSGIWRSNDYGLTWTKIWAKTSNDKLSGNVAYDTTRTGRLWVSTGGSLFKLSGADTGTVTGGGITGSGAAVFCPGSGVAGPMGTDNAGNIYLATQDTGNGAGIWVSSDDGTTWTDATGGDGSFAASNCNPEAISIGPVEPSAGAPKVFVSGSNVVAWGFPTSGGSPPGVSAPFTELQASAQVTAPTGTGNLQLWFSQAGGVASSRGSMLSARLELTDCTATVTPVDNNWVLDVDAPASGLTSGTCRVQIWRYFNNPGGLAGPGLTQDMTTPQTIVPGRKVSLPSTPGAAVVSTGRSYVPFSTQAQAPRSISGNLVPGNPVIFNCSNTSATIKGKLMEYSTPPGTVQFFDQMGTAGAQSAATSLPVSAAGANTFTGGLAVVDYAAFWNPTGSGQSWTTPGGWIADGTINNLSLTFSTYYQAGITVGPTSVTGTINPGSGGTQQAWAAGVATYYATAASPVSISTTTLPNGTVGVPYTATVVAVGGATPYNWSITNNALPAGLVLDPASGIISGTPTSDGIGDNPFDVTVIDSAVQTSTTSFNINIASGLSVTTSALANAQSGVDYLQFLAATGGTGPYIWHVSAGSLPPGLTLDGSNGPTSGVIAGVPVLPGTYNFTVTVTDRLNATASAPLSIVVTAGPLTILTNTLPAGTLGQPYNAQLTASGGGGTYTWSLVSGTLPSGLTLNSNGSITGTLRAAGHFVFVVQVTG